MKFTTVKYFCDRCNADLLDLPPMGAHPECQFQGDWKGMGESNKINLVISLGTPMHFCRTCRIELIKFLCEKKPFPSFNELGIK